MEPPATLLQPDWPLPAQVRAVVSTRSGGVSRGAYAELNLGDHVGDDPAAVAENRRRFVALAGLPSEPKWLSQVHGVRVVKLEADSAAGLAADSCWTDQPGLPCAVLSADCLPALFADRDGRCIAAAHAGWRGLLHGVLEATVAALPVAPERLLVWLGPAIGPEAFQVGDELRQAFVDADAADAAHFIVDGERWRADLFGLARARLRRLGVMAVSGGGLCTHTDTARFFSHRRGGPCGRMASAVWLLP